MDNSMFVDSDDENTTVKYDTIRFYIDVDYNLKSRAKQAGAKWDNNKKSWYIMHNPENDDDIKIFFCKYYMSTEDNLRCMLNKKVMDKQQRSINHCSNADITIVDNKYVEKLKNEKIKQLRIGDTIYWKYYQKGENYFEATSMGG